MHTEPRHDIAVILPCYNEERTIGGVLEEFRRALPEAKLFVFDNDSQDATAEVARRHGAIVRHVALRGKGNVVRRMFADVEADIYVMSDGDLTYEVSRVRQMVDLLVQKNLDIVMAEREGDASAFPPGHAFGNWLFNRIVHFLFGQGLMDIFTGFRVFSHRFVKSFPAHSRGFEIETEMSIHILEMRIPFAEVPMPYRPRPEGSHSKLHKYRDGFRIGRTILAIFKSVKPLFFFSSVALALALLSLVLGLPLVSHWLETGLVPRLPTAILATGLGVLSFLSLACGFILDGLARASREARHMRYLMFQSPFDKRA